MLQKQKKKLLMNWAQQKNQLPLNEKIIFNTLSCSISMQWHNARQRTIISANGCYCNEYLERFFSLDGKPAKWSYDMGVILKGFEGIWMNTGDVNYFNYIQQQMDFFVQNDGTIRAYRPDEYNIDHINNGKLLLLLYRVTGKEKYLKAANLLREQLRTHPRTNEGGFWHKKIYPYQMWLDGLYMGHHFMQNMPCLHMKILLSMISPTSLSGWKNMQGMQRQVYYIMHGMKANR